MGVVAIAAVAFLALRGATGDSGGAGSAEEAVLLLSRAIDAEDPIGAAAALAPGEVRSLGDLLRDAEAKAADAGLAGASGNLLDGIDLSIDDIELEVEELADDVAKVRLRDGRGALRIDPTQVAERIRPLVESRAEGWTIEGSVRDVEFQPIGGSFGGRPVEPFVMVVRQGGGWYVSPAYTAAEVLVQLAGLPPGDFAPEDRVVTPRDIDQPSEVLEELARVADAGDLDALLALVPQVELGVAVAYRDALAELISRAESQLGSTIDESFDLSLDEAGVVEAEIGDGARRLVFEDVRGELAVRYFDNEEGPVTDRAAFRLDERCLGFRSEHGDQGEQCIPDRFSELTGIEAISVVVVREHGTWKLSPVLTLLDHAQRVIETITPDVVLRTLDLEQHAEPAGEVSVGEAIDIETNEAGFATYTFEGAEDQWVSYGLDYDDDDAYLDLEIFTRDGEEVRRNCTFRISCLALLPRAGSYRLVVNAEPSGDGDPYRSVPAKLGLWTVEVKDVALPAEISTVDAPEPGRDGTVYRIAPQPGSWYFDLTFDTWSLRYGDGFPECSSSSVCELAEDAFLLINAPTEGEIVASTRGFADGRSVIGRDLLGSTGVVDLALEVEAGERVVIEVLPSASLDVSVGVTSASGEVYSANSGRSGDSETVEFVAESSSYTVSVIQYTGEGRFEARYFG